MKRSIDVIEHAGEIMKKVNDAVLLTTKKDGQVNAMTISWGGMAIEWGKPLFITYVRESRFTKEFLDATGEFTVNLPMGEFDKKITAVCGAKSGRDMDKVAELGIPKRLMCRAFASFPLRWSAASCSSRNRILPILMPRTRKSGIPSMKRWVAPTSTRPITPKSWRPTLSSSSGYSALCAGGGACRLLRLARLPISLRPDVLKNEYGRAPWLRTEARVHFLVP